AFQKLKTEERSVSESADSASTKTCTSSLCTIFDDDEIVFRSDIQYPVHFAWLTVQVRRHDDACALRDGGFNQRRIDIESVRININKYRLQTGSSGDFGNHPEC